MIHSDLRPENSLLRNGIENELELPFCDFGGPTNGDMGGGHLPNPGFLNLSTEAVDILSRKSVLVGILDENDELLAS